MSVEKRVIVIGGGAAGLMAAGQAAIGGAKTLLLEKTNRLGHKLSITGKGRCNLTNIAELKDFISHYGKNGKFLYQAFHNMFSPELAEFLREQGVDIVIERGGRVFPAGEDAKAVVEVLVRWVKKQSVEVKLGAPVDKLLIDGNKIQGVAINGESYTAAAVILATGGISYPATGSTGDGYPMAQTAGHKIIPPRPSLVGIKTAGDLAKKLQGLALRNIRATLFVDGKKVETAFGEMLFTHFGLSGPIILTLSRLAVAALHQHQKVSVKIDLKPALDEKKLEARLLREIQANGKKQVATLLKSLLPGKLVGVCADLLGLDPLKMSHQITSDERRRLRFWLKEFCFDVSGHRPAAEAIVTAGGVHLKEIDPRTMQSKLISGLYFAGELLDIDGDTGGYNLQAAFSTGWLAGKSASTQVQLSP